jgi:fatty-acid desaturase
MNLEDKTPASGKPQINWTKGNWGTAIFLVIAHLASIAAFFFWSWPAIITAVVFYWVASSLGVGMGYHRLLTHRGYKVPKFVEYFLVTCATMSLEGGPIQWVTTHRIHHAKAIRIRHAMAAGGRTLVGYCGALRKIILRRLSLTTHPI